MAIDANKIMVLILIIGWIIAGMLIMLPSGKTVSKLAYFLCWICYLAKLLDDFIS